MVETKKERAEPSTRYRHPEGFIGLLSKVSLALLPIMGTIYVTHVTEYLGWALYKAQYLSIMLVFVLISTFLTVPATKAASRAQVPWYDGLLILLSVLSGGYVAIFYPSIVAMLGIIDPIRVVLGVIMLFLVLEACRRLVGWPVVIIGLVFICYAPYAYLMPSVLQARDIPWGRVLSYLYLSPAALFGIPLGVVGSIVFSFIFFGRVLFSIGGGQFLSDLALALMGRFRGGPAKVAILASSLFGTLSGSPSANVAMTGIVTIPLMKKTGYKPYFAAAVEAVASTGGLIMPPIMAAVAFIMAEFLEIPYTRIAFAAFIPASLYYIAVFTQVHLEAVKEGHIGLPPEDLPRVKELIKRGWVYLIPAIVLLYCLFILYIRPGTSALYATASTAVVGLLRKDTRNIILNQGGKILVETGRGLLEVAIICSVAGFVIGAISITGLGLSLSDALVTLSGGNVYVLLVLAAVGAIILGMGMPITATYIMLVILIAPALVQLGIQPLAAHLFIMYFGVMSFLTPPVAIASYIAASIAGSEPMRTGFTSVRLGIIAYVVPFVFVLHPGLILMGPVHRILFTTFTALIGTVFLAVAFEGYLFEKLNALERGLMAAGALALLLTNNIKVCGIGLLLILVTLTWTLRRWQASKDKITAS